MNLDLLSLAAPADTSAGLATPPGGPSGGSGPSSGEVFAELAAAILNANAIVTTPAVATAVPGPCADAEATLPSSVVVTAGANPIPAAPNAAVLGAGAIAGVGDDTAVDAPDCEVPGPEDPEPGLCASDERPSAGHAVGLVASIAGAVGIPGASVAAPETGAPAPGSQPHVDGVSSTPPAASPAGSARPAPPVLQVTSPEAQLAATTPQAQAVVAEAEPPRSPPATGVAHDRPSPSEPLTPASTARDEQALLLQGEVPTGPPVDPHSAATPRPTTHTVDPVQHAAAHPNPPVGGHSARTVTGTASTASSSPSAAPFVDPNVARIGGAVRTLHHDGGQALSIDLTPVELGKVHVELVSRHGRVEVHLQADRAASADLLRDASTHLRQHLEADGLTLDRIGVGVTGDGGRSGAQRQAPEDAPSPQGWERTPSQGARRPPTRLTSPLRPHRQGQVGGLDVDL